MSEKCIWCGKETKVNHTYVMEYRSPYDGAPAVWRKLWETESHCYACAKEDLYDRLNEATHSAGSAEGLAEWRNSEYRVRLVKPITIPRVDEELIQFAYFLQNAGELRDGIIHFFADPTKYEPLFKEWVKLKREGFDDWQIDQKLTNHETGGWIVEVKT